MFDSSRLQCVLQDQCVASSNVDDSVAPSNNFCSTVDRDGLYPVGECLPLYYACYNRETQVKECPRRRVFDAGSGHCSKPILECRNQIVPINDRLINRAEGPIARSRVPIRNSPFFPRVVFSCRRKVDGAHSIRQCGPCYKICRLGQEVSETCCTDGLVFDERVRACVPVPKCE